MKTFIHGMFLLLFFSINPLLYSDGIHEAFLTSIVDGVILDAAPKGPPPEIRENIPPQPSQDMIWINGYWRFDPQTNAFTWVCGVWRRPPVGQVWNVGMWQKVDDNWVWLRGFWSSKPASELVAIPESPPPAQEDTVPNSPGDGYFWVPGVWEYSSGAYTWSAGRWEKMDKEWMLVPAHYEWRNEGYLFIAGYWDYALDNRGVAYNCQGITETTTVFTPQQSLSTETVVEQLFVYYPNYTYFYNHYWHYHPDFWVGYPFTPPWWGWNLWWGIGWGAQWDLWWWWSHPGFAAPGWLGGGFAGIIIGPPVGIGGIFAHVHTPFFITKRGVVSPALLSRDLRALNPRITAPILPRDTAQRRALLEGAGSKIKDPQMNLRPSGTLNAQGLAKKPIERPSITKEPSVWNRAHDFVLPNRGKVTIPGRPTEPHLKPGKGSLGKDTPQGLKPQLPTAPRPQIDGSQFPKPSIAKPGVPSGTGPVTKPGLKPLDKPAVTLPGKDIVPQGTKIPPRMTEPGRPQVTLPQKPQVIQPQRPQVTQPQRPQVTQPQRPQVTQPQRPQVTQPQRQDVIRNYPQVREPQRTMPQRNFEARPNMPQRDVQGPVNRGNFNRGN
jgi:hypothetical protein